MTQHPRLFYQRLGAWLKETRKECGITQDKMGGDISVAFQQIQKYENGSNRIPVDKLLAWCRVCGAKVTAALRAAEVRETKKGKR